MLELFLVILTVVLLVYAWQQWRYLRIRRDSAQDRQQLLHSGNVFHVLMFFRLHSGDRIVATTSRFKQQVMSTRKARLIYAGKAAFSIKSVQLGDRDWDGVIMFAYPSRLDYEESFADPQTCEARELFADSYIHGMRRNCKANLAIPAYLLRLRLRDVLRGRWQVAPLQRSPLYATAPEFDIWRSRMARLQALHEVNREGLVVFNLVKPGNALHIVADDVYGREMLSRMAALSHGPLHAGRSVALEGGARFNHVYIVHYPSARYFADLFASEYYQDIAVDRQRGDTIMVPTVPITYQL